MGKQLLEMKNIYKVYGNGVVANEGVDLSLNCGEIHALVGENGAGKSTLMKILFGMEQADTGTISLKNKSISIESPLKAIDLGIGMVHQHFMLVPSLTVAENILLGIEPTQGIVIDEKKRNETIINLSEKYNLQVNPKEVVENISVGEMQKIEILKALARGAEILILDEPTAVLTPQETDELFTQLEHLKTSGLTIIFISHKLQEVKRISDRITVMRSGKSIGTYDTNSVSEAEISQLMVGREKIEKIEKDYVNWGDEVLRINDLSKQEGKINVLSNINLSLKQGQILGVAGVDGNGQDELVAYITGKDTIQEPGKIKLLNQDIYEKDIRDIRDIGLSYIPSDRMRDGVALNHNIKENLISTFADCEKFGKGINFDDRLIIKSAKEQINKFRIKTNSENQIVGMLSGGNIQKVVVARELLSDPSVIIAEQPTRGIDVGAASLIHKELLDLQTQGKAILLVSADLNEVLEVSDSLIVMHKGKITAYFNSVEDVSEEELGYYMLGIKEQEHISYE